MRGRERKRSESGIGNFLFRQNGVCSVEDILSWVGCGGFWEIWLKGSTKLHSIGKSFLQFPFPRNGSCLRTLNEEGI